MHRREQLTSRCPYLCNFLSLSPARELLASTALQAQPSVRVPRPQNHIHCDTEILQAGLGGGWNMPTVTYSCDIDSSENSFYAQSALPALKGVYMSAPDAGEEY